MYKKYCYCPDLSLWGFGLVRMLSRGAAVIPPDQRGAEPLHFTQVDEEGTVRTVHTVEGIARVGCPACTHPLNDQREAKCLEHCN